MRIAKLHRQRGLTLLETTGAILISAVVIVILARVVNFMSGYLTNSDVAQQTVTFGQGVNQYITNNLTTVSATATATTPMIITVGMLNAAGINTGESATNGFGQTMCALVLQPSAGSINAVIVTEGGTTVNDLDLGNVAGNIGAAGGGIYSTSSANFTGTQGGWGFPIGNYANANNAGTRCNGSAGAVTIATGHPVMALWYSGFNTTAGVLYRNAIPGQPQLNQMNTPIVMSSLATAGTACTAVGAIAQNSNQTSLVECGSNGVWNTVGNTVAGIANGAACTVAGQLGSDAKNISYSCNGSYWIPLVVTATYSASSPASCTINNQLAVSVQTSEELICRNNFWIRIADVLPSTSLAAQMGQVVVSDNQFVAAPTCAAGGKYWGWLETTQFGVDVSTNPPREKGTLIATPSALPAGWTFNVDMIDTTAASYDGSYMGLQEIFHFGCSY